MSVEPDALAVAQQLRELAADPLNRRAIVEDRGCLPGLILLLDHGNPQVVYTALQSRRSVCEEALLKVRGVISFTFQMEQRRCIIRIRSDLTAETLGAAITSTGVLTAQQVVKREDGSEVLIPCVAEECVCREQGVCMPCVCRAQGVCVPEYLPEEDESPAVEADRAVSSKPTNQDSASWLNTATNFLSRSFYW